MSDKRPDTDVRFETFAENRPLSQRPPHTAFGPPNPQFGGGSVREFNKGKKKMRKSKSTHGKPAGLFGTCGP